MHNDDKVKKLIIKIATENITNITPTRSELEEWKMRSAFFINKIARMVQDETI